MDVQHAALVVADDGQGWQQIGELLLAFALSSLIGFEREFQGKSAGLRTQAIVGTTSALIVLVSKYGFGDVVASDNVSFDPSRVASMIVSGIGFLGAGLILTRRGAIHGLTTAASVWETAAIGMAVGAGLAVLALIVTGLHFVSVLVYAPLVRQIKERGHAERTYTITYEDGRGVLRDLLAACSDQAWKVSSMSVVGHSRTHDASDSGLVTIGLTLSGARAATAAGHLGGVDGVVRVDAEDEED